MNELRNLFDRILSPAHQLLEELGPGRKVYSELHIDVAFEVSYFAESIRLFKENKDSIADSSFELGSMVANLEGVQHLGVIDPALINESGNFDAIKYLDSKCVSIQEYLEEEGPEALCFPRKDRQLLEPCFKHYHVYKFYEKYIHEIPDGENVFLKLIPDLEPFILSSGINDTFYWDTHDTQFLYDAEEKERLEKEAEEERNLGKD